MGEHAEKKVLILEKERKMETRRANRMNTATTNAEQIANQKALATRQRGALGEIRTTRAQQLRNKMIQKNQEAKIPAKRPLTELKIPQKEIEEAVNDSVEEENMEVSLSEEENQNDDCAQDYLVGHYVEKVYDYLRYLEHKHAITPRYLDGHPEVNPKMRSILVDWLVQVHKRFKLVPDTLYLTVGILDRYLSNCEKISKNEMQLIGITSLMIACKTEEILCPEVDDYVYICDNAYNSEEILKMELEIFHTLDFNVGQPMSISFLRRYSNMGGVEARQHSMAKYLLELSLVDYDLMSMKPSIVAAGALNLSLQLLGNNEWTDVLQHYSEYSNEDLKHVVNLLCKCLYQIEFTKTGQKLAAVKKKYSESKTYSISTCAEISANREMILENARKAKDAKK